MFEVLRPLAGNVVGNDSIRDPCVDIPREDGRHGIISVDVPESGVSSTELIKNECITFPPSGGRQLHSEGRKRGGRRPRRHPWRRIHANTS